VSLACGRPLGATAVGIGRPYCYALAIAGESGVREVVQNFQADFDLTMGLRGRSVAEIGPEALVPADRGR
jgi:lactate 2-monooxygenase